MFPFARNVLSSPALIHEALASHTRAYHAVHHHRRVHTHPDPDYRASYPQEDQKAEFAAYHTLQGAGIPCDSLYRLADQKTRPIREAAVPSPRLAELQGSRFEEVVGGIPKVCARRRRGSSRQVGSLL